MFKVKNIAVRQRVLLGLDSALFVRAI